MNDILQEKIDSKEAVIGVIGFGYIGLSLLEAFGKAGFSLVGYDRDVDRVNMLKHKKSYLNFMPLTDLFEALDKHKFEPSADPAILNKADVIVISVPTSTDSHHVPNLTNLRETFKTIDKVLKKNQLIIIQSSTYPGTTEEELLPLLAHTNLKVGEDYYLAHVPEVADIGNPNFSFTQVPRIVSGITPACQQKAASLYEKIGCKVVFASSTKIAEAAKLLQNAFRLINISFINEMKIMFDRMGMDVWEVIEAASSKPFGFIPFYPGPGIGGDCIPVVPLYLIWKASLTGGPTTLLERAAQINEMMPEYVCNKLMEGLNEHKKTMSGAKVLVFGVGYKKDVNDLREAPALKILAHLKKMHVDVYYTDPFIEELPAYAESHDFHLKSVKLDYEKLALYDAVVIVTDHSIYDWKKIVKNSQLIIDTRNVTAHIVDAKNKVIKG